MKRSGQVGLVLMAALGLTACGSSKPKTTTTTPSQQSQQSQNSPSGTPPSSTASGSEQATMTWDNKPRDPCAQQYFDEKLCQDAIAKKGYHYGGTWIPFVYAYPYSYYYGSHSSFLSSGGRYVATPVEVYSPGFKAPAQGEVVRGGFGKTASSVRSGSSSSGSGAKAGS